MISRRKFLLASLLAPLGGCAARPIRFESYPFTLGVASGYPTLEGMALWTRLAPRPLEGGGMPPHAVDVRWEVAEDEAFSRIARSGNARAVAENAHAVHVEAGGLAPGRAYWYRFIAGGEASPVGRTRTAPRPGEGDERLRMALGSCQQYEQGFFTAHRRIAEDSPDLVAFVGDYIYESTWGNQHVRSHHISEPRTLAQYRDRYAQYKMDPDLQLCHATAPWIVTWDDHEVDNDYANDRSEDLDPRFLERRAAAYKAFYEHMPLRPSVLLAGGAMRIYGSLDWGSLATFHVLDNRQYRSHQACPRPLRGGSAMVPDSCRDRMDPRLTMLGEAQERWLDAGLGGSRAAWNFIVQQTLFAPAPRRNARQERVHWTDGWDGYPAARERLIRSLVERRPANPVILGGDVHAAMAASIHAIPQDPASPVVATEYVTTSITSQGFASMISGIAKENPHIHYAESQVRGYGLLELDRRKLEASHRGIGSVKVRDAKAYTANKGTIESGHPGIAR
ncbi:MAG TPA: alkaline phosphatase D family protein [Usitatibacter sp.]|nr:alkaline phosphatase D family protein [Usitatibacter sp.]